MECPVLTREECLQSLQNDYGGAVKTWTSLNGISQKAIVIQMKSVDWAEDIYKRIFENNVARGEDPIVAVPVAGWEVKEETEWYDFFLGFISKKVRKERELEEYAKSCSTSTIPTAKNADVILQVPPQAHAPEYFWDKEHDHCLKIPPGIRITDLDDYLDEMGLALPHQMSTLDICSFIGMIMTGCYGPALKLGPASDGIILEIVIVTPTGEVMTLSNKDHPDLFAVLKDCALGTCFVKSVTIKGLIPKQTLERRDVLYKGVGQFSKAMRKTHMISQNDHYMVMYIPVEGVSNIRVTMFNPAKEGEKPEKGILPKNFWDYVNLMKTEAGEPLIRAIVRTKVLHPFYDTLLKAAAFDTFGTDKEKRQIVESRDLHVFDTYTDLKIKVINWTIQVSGPEDAEKLNIGLFRMTKKKIRKLKSEGHDAVILNAFARYNAGIYFPEGEGGIAPLAKSKESDGILAFEYVTYVPLDKGEGFKQLVDKTIRYLKKDGRIFAYHPGKNLPEGIVSLTQILTDENGQRRLKNFQDVVAILHGGVDKLECSSILTRQKAVFLGLRDAEDVTLECSDEEVGECSRKEKKKALKKVIKIAKQQKDTECVKNAKETLSVV